MKCKYCGFKLPDGADSCPRCGAWVLDGDGNENAVYEDIVFEDGISPEVDRNKDDVPMKWHNFLVHFSLWAGAVSTFLSGIKSLTGLQYGFSKAAVYRAMPDMKDVDNFYGVTSLLLAAFMFITAARLLKRKRGAPALLNIYYCVSLIISIVYCVMVLSAIREYAGSINVSSLYFSMFFSIGLSLVMIIINSVYYSKRKHLFCN